MSRKLKVNNIMAEFMESFTKCPICEADFKKYATDSSPKIFGVSIGNLKKCKECGFEYDSKVGTELVEKYALKKIEETSLKIMELYDVSLKEASVMVCKYFEQNTEK